MSSSLPRAHGLGPKTERYVGAVRADAKADGVSYVGKPYLFCTSCGGATISKGDFALAAGVTPLTVTRFLERKPIRPDVADRIRQKLVRVIE